MYRTPGYFEYTRAEVLIDAVKDITRDPSYLKQIDDAFSRIEKTSWRLTKFSLDNVLSLASDDTNPGFAKALTHVVVDLLHANGMVDFKIPVIGYRYQPSLTIDEAVDLVMNDQIPKVEIPAFKGITYLGTILSMTKMFIVQLSAMLELRKSVVVKFYQMLDHLLHVVKHGGTLSQDQKTFLLHMMDDQFNISKYVGARHEPQPQECNIPSVFDWYNKLLSYVEAGPCTRFITMISNRSLEELVQYCGPFVPSLPIAAGYLHQIGPFTNINLQQIDSFKWDHMAQLLGGAEAVRKMEIYQGSTLSPNGGAGLTPRTIPSPALRYNLDDLSAVGRRVPFILDLPDVDIVWRSGTIIARYHSIWRDRPVELNYNMGILQHDDIREILVDKGLNYETFGETVYGRLSIDEWTFADMSYFESTEGKKRKVSFDTKCKVWYPNPRSPTGELMADQIDMRPFYANHGNYQIVPAFAESMRPLRAMLEEPQPEAVNYLRMRIGLNEFQFKRIERGLTVAYNSFRLQTRYGRVPEVTKPGETYEAAIERIVRTITYGG